MSSTNVILIAIAAVLVAAIVVGLVIRSHQQTRRRRRLHERFGPEYDRLVAASGASAAGRELEARERRAARYNIRRLSQDEQTRFSTRWQQVQAEFVDNPKVSLGHADDFLAEVMHTRGYPVQDFEQRSADLSVDHPVVVQHYRAAHAIALRHKKGETTTEDLRQAMIHYRALFDEMVAAARPTTPASASVAHAAE